MRSANPLAPSHACAAGCEWQTLTLSTLGCPPQSIPLLRASRPVLPPQPTNLARSCDASPVGCASVSPAVAAGSEDGLAALHLPAVLTQHSSRASPRIHPWGRAPKAAVWAWRLGTPSRLGLGLHLINQFLFFSSVQPTIRIDTTDTSSCHNSWPQGRLLHTS